MFISLIYVTEMQLVPLNLNERKKSFTELRITMKPPVCYNNCSTYSPLGELKRVILQFKMVR